ncbi:MAG: DUF4390 domain-containing protein [Thermodesulfobacteriota bacterium]
MGPATPAKIYGRAFSLCLLLVLIVGARVSAQEPALTGLTVQTAQDKVLFSATVENAFTEKMEEAVKSGITATFSFIVTLESERSMWLDETIAEKEETHTLAYDPLKGQYAVTRSWENETPFLTASFEEARARMCKIEGMRLTRTRKLEKGATYIVSAMAELDTMSLPPYLYYILFFVSSWDAETDWQTVSFTY